MKLVATGNGRIGTSAILTFTKYKLDGIDASYWADQKLLIDKDEGLWKTNVVSVEEGVRRWRLEGET